MSSAKWIKADTKAKILDLNAINTPARIIAQEVKTSPATVYRAIAEYAGDCRAREVRNRKAAGLLDDLVRLAIDVKNGLAIAAELPGPVGDGEAA